MKRKINYVIMALCIVIAGLFLYQLGLRSGWPWAAVAVLAGIFHLVFAAKETIKETPEGEPLGVPTELVLLSEEDSILARWEIYGKNGIVIGRDIGENNVTVNLDHTVYASMIDIEHAVLNYSGNTWYVEDISSKNGVSIQKSDGRRYKISYGKPCKLEQGDILFIGLARLQLL